MKPLGCQRGAASSAQHTPKEMGVVARLPPASPPPPPPSRPPVAPSEEADMLPHTFQLCCASRKVRTQPAAHVRKYIHGVLASGLSARINLVCRQARFTFSSFNLKNKPEKQPKEQKRPPPSHSCPFSPTRTPTHTYTVLEKGCKHGITTIVSWVHGAVVLRLSTQ